MHVVNVFYEIARQYKPLRSFRYGSPSGKGAGNDAYPMMWVDDPIRGATNGGTNLLRFTVNVDFLGIPQNDKEVLSVQQEAFKAGILCADQINKQFDSSKVMRRDVTKVVDYSFITLREYYDDNAAGVRFTYIVETVNPADLCADEFDKNKTFNKNKVLPDMTINNSAGCALFNRGLPFIELNQIGGCAVFDDPPGVPPDPPEIADFNDDFNEDFLI